MNNNSNMSFMLSILLLCCSCHYNSAKSNKIKTINSLHDSSNDTTYLFLDNKSKGQISFYYTDEFYDSHPPFFLSKNDTIKKIFITAPTLLIDAYHHIPYLIYPREKVEIHVSDNKIATLTTSNNEARNNELNFFCEQYKSGDSLMLRNTFFYMFRDPKHVNVSDLNILEQTAKLFYIKRQSFLEKYKSEHNISGEFYNYAQALFKNFYYIQLFSPTRLININFSELPANFHVIADSIINNFQCDTCITNYAYQLASAGIENYLEKQTPNINIYKIIDDRFSNKTARFMQFVAMKNIINIQSDSTLKLIQTFINTQNDLYSNYLKETLAFNKNTYSGDQLINVKGEKSSWDELIKASNNKIIYIDFWASWCAPCREEMPASILMKQKLKDKNVAFIYLSIDDNIVAWKNAIKEEGISEKDCYLFANKKSSNIIDKYKINFVPRYILIGKDGKIIASDAPRPSDKALQELIEKNL